MINQHDTFNFPEFPFIPSDLLTALDTAFPLTCPSLDDTERQMFVMVGQRKVLEFLKERFREQQESGRFVS